MHETAEDLEALQALLDDTRSRAGLHLRSIFSEVTEMTAQEVVAETPGVQVLNVATVTNRGEPRVAPVDGLFYRARFHFGSSVESVRARHLRVRPYVSASHARGEDLAIIVHGIAVALDVAAPENVGFRSYLVEVYPDWDDWYSDAPAPYWRIEPQHMFAARVSRLRDQA